MTVCSKCQKSLAFHINQMSKNSKFISLDKTTMTPHVCDVRNIIKCNQYGIKIIFENDFKNKNGKSIPIDATNGEAHYCKKRMTGFDEFFWS